MTKSTTVIIVGGGFGGVRTALKLAKHSAIHIKLISDRPDFRYYPALYRYAVGHSHLEAVIPLEELFAQHPNVEVIIEPATKTDDQKKILKTNKGSHHYDVLVVAVGNVTN